MGKLAKETIVKSPGEAIVCDFIFPDGDFLPSANLVGPPTITASPVTTPALTLTSFSVSARRAQVKISGGLAPTTYQIKCVANDDGSPTQTHEGLGNLTVEALG